MRTISRCSGKKRTSNGIEQKFRVHFYFGTVFWEIGIRGIFIGILANQREMSVLIVYRCIEILHVHIESYWLFGYPLNGIEHSFGIDCKTEIFARLVYFQRCYQCIFIVRSCNFQCISRHFKQEAIENGHLVLCVYHFAYGLQTFGKFGAG